MLRLEALDEKGQPVVLQANRLVVRDAATNTVIMVAVGLAPGQYIAASAADPDFNQILKGLRIDDTVIVQRKSSKDLPPISL